MSSLSNSIRAAILACMAFGIFTVADTLTKLLTQQYTTYQVTLMVMGSALVLVVLQAFVTGKARTLLPVYPAKAFLRAVLISVDTLLIFYAFSKLPLTDVYVVAFTNPIMVAILAFLLLKERLTAMTVGAILLGFIGVLVALQPGSATIGLGHLAAITAIFLFACSILVLRVTKPDESDTALVATMFLVLSGMALLLMLYDGDIRAVTWHAAALVAANALCTVIGNTMLVQAFRLGNAGSVAPFQYTQLVWGTALGFFVFGDPVQLHTIIGAFIIIASGIIVVRSGNKA